MCATTVAPYRKGLSTYKWSIECRQIYGYIVIQAHVIILWNFLETLHTSLSKPNHYFTHTHITFVSTLYCIFLSNLRLFFFFLSLFFCHSIYTYTYMYIVVILMLCYIYICVFYPIHPLRPIKAIKIQNIYNVYGMHSCQYPQSIVI